MHISDFIHHLRTHPLPEHIYRDTFSCLYTLIGSVLVTEIDGFICAGYIVEAEAYVGSIDKACHAYNGKRTARTEVMYGAPGHAYIYSVHTQELLGSYTQIVCY